MKRNCKENGCFCKLVKGEKKTLQDDKTKLYLQAENDLYIIKIDNGIIKNTKDGIKKCDYLSYSSDNHSNFIELKGANIKNAYTQIEHTILNLKNTEYEKYINNKYVQAFIVSPVRKKIPKGVDKYERNLSKILAKLSKEKNININSLIKYIIVKPNLPKLRVNDNTIYCSGTAPLTIN